MTTTRWEGGAEACAASAPEFSWPTAGPGEVGLDADILEASVRPMQGANPANLHSVVVVRDGTIVFERYFSGADNAWGQRLGEVEFGPGTLHDLRSVSKSVVGALVGIAHGDGALPDLDAPLSELLPG